MLGYIFILAGLALITYGIFLLEKEKELAAISKSQPVNENIHIIHHSTKEDDQHHSPTVAEQKLRDLIHIAGADGYFSPNENLLISKKALELNISKEDVETMIAAELQNKGVKPEVKLIDKLKEKGDEFESYTISKFNKKYFKLLFWAGDKHIPGIKVDSNSDPDLKFLCKLSQEMQEFAVECKFRSAYFNNGIDWAEEYKIKHYRSYQTKYQIPVFVAIGVGGQPSSPNELYIIPLNDIRGTFLSLQFLQKYRKLNFTNNEIFFNHKNLSLS
jgi:hypothetical protein